LIRGTREAGNETEKVYIRDHHINSCLGCCACQRNGGVCVQEDDMPELYEKMKAADGIVLPCLFLYLDLSDENGH
jgi:multimeric flavodoxin WrbA